MTLASVPAPAVRSQALQAAFDAEALRQGFNPRDPWVANYVDYEWKRLRHVLQAYGLPNPGSRAFEFGCNVGASAIVLSTLGAEVDALEVDPRALALARANAARYGIDSIRFAGVAPDAPLPYEDRSFDLIVCNSVLEYVPHARLPAVVDELSRVLRPGGHLLIVGTSSRLWPREFHSGRWFTNWVPRWTGVDVPRGVGPIALRRLLGARYRNRDVDDGGAAWLQARRDFNGGAAPRSAAAVRRLAAGLGVGPGWITASLSALMIRSSEP